MASYVGSNVTINCGSALGHYQGIVKEVDQKLQTITISNPFCNGVKCPMNEMTVKSSDIVEITIIDSLLTNSKEQENETGVKIPSSSTRKEKRRQKDVISQQSGNFDRDTSAHSPQPGSNRALLKPYPQNRKGQFRRNDDCFNADVRDMTEDFDFEKNLALFDKAAVYRDINSGSDGEIRTPSKRRQRKTEEKYKHDEFVLQKGPVVYRQIITNESHKTEISEYYTDAGLVVPTISSETYKQIIHAAELMGFGVDRQTEIFGANSSLMALTLMGGTNRLHPRNSHQPPSVVVMCGPHRTGAGGVATARHLSNHNVKVQVFLPNFVKIHSCLQDELRLLSLTGANVISEYSNLPSNPVDLILSALDEEDSEFLYQQPWYQHAVRWCNENRAPLMCLSPPAKSPPDLHIKWSVCAVLPFSLPSDYGALYMVDIGIPVRAFSKAGIQYQSPFCGKSSLCLNRSNK